MPLSQAALTEEERERNLAIFTEVMRAEFPDEEMADRSFRDKVGGFFHAVTKTRMSVIKVVVQYSSLL